MASKVRGKAKPTKAIAKTPAKAPVKLTAKLTAKPSKPAKAAKTPKPAKAAKAPKVAPPPKAVKPAKPAPVPKAAKVAKPAKTVAPAPAKQTAKGKSAPVATATATKEIAAKPANGAKGAAKPKKAPGPTASERAAAARLAMCREPNCELSSTTVGYCRMHYIKNWKKIKRKELILKEKRLDSYIEELVAKYPDRYIDAIRQDLSTEKDFAKVVAELEIEEFNADEFDPDADSAVEDIIESSGAAPAKRAPDYDDDEDFNF